MYTLYYMEGSCSLATLSVLNEIGVEDVRIIDKEKVAEYKSINPVGAVPALDDGSTVWREGAALIIYLLDKHESNMLPENGDARQSAIENIMFANATMHPAYGRLFFLNQAVEDDQVKLDSMAKATNMINDLWKAVEKELQNKVYLGGSEPSAADFMLAVYSRWGEMFPVDIVIPPKAKEMIASIISRPSFIKALDMEKTEL
ncbi:glutathione S-transferase [Sinobacterium caligoides]|uniref:Glutathione S-transferase n=1 Tax=Sinobacterium caligoides TaxID=933926 RepID=A0A3N2DDU1_9GAMM|nr:glutathione S-transferase family protein [Sinobacterium caligoides]ROR97897.1 glutathione S-transferase [Sinobacterium caligoides]